MIASDKKLFSENQVTVTARGPLGFFFPESAVPSYDDQNIITDI